MISEVKLQSTITCPSCGQLTTETMPTDACQFFWKCPLCDEIAKPLDGDCCVFCSYGTDPCPPVQMSGKIGLGGNCS